VCHHNHPAAYATFKPPNSPKFLMNH